MPHSFVFGGLSAEEFTAQKGACVTAEEGAKLLGFEDSEALSAAIDNGVGVAQQLRPEFDRWGNRVLRVEFVFNCLLAIEDAAYNDLAEIAEEGGPDDYSGPQGPAE